MQANLSWGSDSQIALVLTLECLVQVSDEVLQLFSVAQFGCNGDTQKESRF